MTLYLRCQWKSGKYVLSGLTLKCPISKLKDQIEAATNIPRDCIKVKQGFPPKVVDLSSECNELSTLPFRSGDTLIVEEDASLRKQAQQTVDNALQNQMLHTSGMLMRKVVPADNSCLFTSVDCVMNNGKVDLSVSSQMRDLIASIVMSDPVTYDSAILGKSSKDYCAWIRKKDSWGGAIEISILSKSYEVEIDVVDTQSGRIDRFGEDKNYPRRVLVLYDGIHYDPLILEPLVPGEPVKTIFSTKDDSVLAQALDIANESKQSRQYTDVGQFTLRCLICNKSLVGQKEAQEHAKLTAHINFGEY